MTGPDIAALNARGIEQHKENHLPEAINTYREALSHAPDNVGLLTNLGSALTDNGQPGEAEQVFKKALSLKPDHVDAHYNLANCLMMMERYREGFAEYEWRWPPEKRAGMPPYWDGKDAPDKTLFLSCEQGIGDIIQFARYIAFARQKVGKTILLCPPFLGRLLSSIEGIDQLVPDGAAIPQFDLFAPLLSLPHILDMEVPDTTPYLKADPHLVDKYRPIIKNDARITVGIAWNCNRQTELVRYMPLDAYRSITSLPNVRCISLHRKEENQALETAEDHFGIETLGVDFGAGPDGFLDAAAAMMSLDYVLTIDTSFAHLAGALGVEGLIALKKVPNWRWQLTSARSMWYKSLHLFRQPQWDDWGSVTEQIIAKINAKN